MDHLRQGVGLRGYGQRDPLVEYKHESYKMFTELLGLIDKQVVYSIYKVGLGTAPGASLMERRNKTVGSEASHSLKKVGRNDLCFCGSGKKYKRCHGK